MEGGERSGVVSMDGKNDEGRRDEWWKEGGMNGGGKE